MSLEQYGNAIIKTHGKGTVAFELRDPDLFYMTGYKVIRNFSGGGLIVAQKTLLNGKTRLVYDLKDYVPITSVLDEIGSDRYSMLLHSLLSLCERIRENGFIQGEHLCLEGDMVFVDPATLQVWVIYVPLKQRESRTMELDGLDRQLAKFLSGIMDTHPIYNDGRMRKIREYLDNGRIDIERFKEMLTSASTEQLNVMSYEMHTDELAPPESLILERIGGTQRLYLHIPSSGAVIGRNEEYSQIIIPDSSVSKKHCLIRKVGNTWSIQDLQSSNHTWIGNSDEWLTPFTEYEIRPGDVVRISRFIFQVRAGIGD